MRISDWSSDVCSSDLPGVRVTFEKNTNDWRDVRGYVESVEIIVINDATARTAALSSGQVNFINRVDPKTVDLLKRGPNVSIQNTSGRGHYVFIMHCNRSEEHTSELQSLMRISYAVF